MRIFISLQGQKVIIALVLGLALIQLSLSLVNAVGPGDLDETFNGTGIITTTISGENVNGTSIAVQSDGKIVVSGNGPPLKSNFILVRYNTNGDLDETFNLSGKVVAPIGTGLGFGSDIAIQSDGKIVVAGTDEYAFGKYQIATIRFDKNGQVDTTFGNNGIVNASDSTGVAVGNAVAVQSDDKILVAGRIFANLTIIRYTITGTLDTTFNSSGIVTTNFNSIDARDIAYQNNKIVTVGGLSNNDQLDYAVMRYNIDGNVDNAFGINGLISTSVVATGESDIGYHGVAIQPDDKIVTVGEGRDQNGRPTLVLARYTNEGQLDPEFNAGKVITTALEAGAAGAKVVLQVDGKIIVVGVAIEEGVSKLLIARYNKDGSLDTSFGNNGIVTTTNDGKGITGRAVTIQEDGKIVATGFERTLTVVRYLGGTIQTLYLPVILKQEQTNE